MGASDLLIRDEHTLDLIESTDVDGDGVFNADGTVNVALIRPCDGRGPGGRIYTREVLEATAPMYSGWPSYMNHEDPKARRAAAKMRRGPEELAGELRETAWDPTYTTPDDPKFGYEPGAVVGKFMPANDLVEQLVRRVPGQLKLSIKAQATGLRRSPRKDGTPGMLVEGIENDPENSSFDLVTAAGAGGHVRSLVESLYDPSNATDGHADDDTLNFNGEHIDMGDMTLQEALATPEVQAHIEAKAAAKAEARVDEILEEKLGALLGERDGELRESLGQENRLRSLHAEAKRLIEAAKLPKAAQENLLEDYGLTEAEDDTVTAGRSLSLIEAVVDGEGKVTKPAKLVLKDAIDDDVKRVRNVLREAAPTVPQARGAGADSATGAQFGGETSGWAERVKARGLNPEMFGAPKPATTTPTE